MMDRQTGERAESSTLPIPLTSLIGREREVEAVLGLVERPDVRLVTLTGPGGAGKTRLALAVSTRLLTWFEDGVYFVDLAALRDPGLVLPTIARALGVHETGDQPLIESLQRHLSRRSVLLVLDNFEQLLPAAPTVALLLHTASRLKVLVTSRAALHLSGEHELPVPPLAFPDLRHLPDVDALAEYAAVALFLQRAQAVRPDFQVTAANAATIAELCARLDGLPLAIELAAARVKLLPPQALLSRLGNRLGLLTGGARDRPARQQTLRATIDWSYDLLDPAERILFNRLAVFAGGATLDAIEGVCNVDDALAIDVLDRLSSLADESLLRQIDSGADEPRFAMLETIREYALERLEAGGEADVVRARHADWYLATVEAAEQGFKGPEQRVWLERLESEYDNARAALSWAIERRQVALALRLAGALGQFWQLRDRLTEGVHWLEQALDLGADDVSPVRAKALNAAGSITFLLGEHSRAAALHQESLDLWRQLGDTAGLAAALHNLARDIHYQGDYDQAARLYHETLALWRQLDDKRGLSISLNSLGVLLRNRGEHEAARELYEESLAINRELQNIWGQALLLNNLARITRDLGDIPHTRVLCSESLDLFAELGDRHGITWVVSNLAIVAQRQGALERAARLIGATEAIREALGSSPFSLSPGERATYEQAIALVRDGLGEAKLETLQAAGRAMSLDEILDFARSDADRPGAPLEAGTALAAPVAISASVPPPVTASARVSSQPNRQPSPLTRRETEVALLVARGLTNRQVANELVISEGTVSVHLEHIFSKLGVRSRAQLAVWVVERGI